jgi:riboflavin synthase
MFTGIVKGKARVESVTDLPNFRTISVELPPGQEQGIEIGASISVDGVCLTVVAFQERLVTFEIVGESLNRTTLGALRKGDNVNIERAARDGVEIGGHPLSGHIDCVGTVVAIERPENNLVMTFQVPSPFIRYIFSKGYIGLNGTSLTVTDPDKKASTFQVWLIPETLRITSFSEKVVGDRINVEIERGTQVVVDAVREFLEDKFSKKLPQIQALLDSE